MPELIPQPDLLDMSDSELARCLDDPQRCDRARRYQLPAQYYEDLTQAGFVGLMKAINSFDPAIRPELKPYARACAAGEIKRYFRDKRWVIRVSRADQEVLLAAKRAEESLGAELGGTPTEAQVAARLGVTTDDLRHAYRAHLAFAPDSIDAPVSADDDRQFGELIGGEDPALAHADEMDAVRQHWRDLPDPQRRVLALRFYGNLSQAQVADRLNCSQMHVSRLQSRALTFLRGRLQAT